MIKGVGINSGEFNSSAILIIDGVVKCGAPEERYSRQKKTKAFPRSALDFVLKKQGIKLENVDFIAQAWNPGANWIKYNPLISSYRIKREDYFYSIPDNLFNFTERQPSEWVKMKCGDILPPIYYVQHHRCHVANAFFLSPYNEAAFLSADYRGEIECLIKGYAVDNNINILGLQTIPNSLGMYYATFTEMLGYRPDNDEWKVMALSAYQVDCEEFRKKIESTVHFLNDGYFELDTTYYKGALHDQPKLYTEKLFRLLDGNLQNDSEREMWGVKVAKAMQLVAEQIAVHVLNDLWDKTKSDNIVLSGGFFMNSVLNGKIADLTRFKNVYISYAPDDVGNGIGAALYVHHCILKNKKICEYRSSSIGPQYDRNEIVEVLERRKISYNIINDPQRKVAELLSDGRVVAIFQGRMEFGDRALGNRSILGDPRSAVMKDKINSMIKYRESFRPFAPAALYEKVSQYFEVDPDYECNYMEKVVKVRKEYHSVIPAVTHFDGSGRLQTVKYENDPYFYKVISDFEKITGIPIVLNTSFNINGEPIVLSPDDAVSTFYNSGLEYLMLEDILLQKH